MQTPIRCVALHPAPTPGGEWTSTHDALATDPEVLVLAVRMVGQPDAELDRWQAAVLQKDGEEAAKRADWRPSGWHAQGLERRLLNRAVTQQADAAAACARVLATWAGAGALDCELSCNSLMQWFRDASQGGLRCPQQTSKTPGVLRHHQAAVRVARLVRDRRADLHAAWEAAFVEGAGAIIRPPTKQEVIDGLSSQLEEQAVAHNSEVEKLSGTTDELAAIVRRAGSRATKAQQRAGKVRKINRTTWRQMLKEMRGDLAAAAVEDVEAAHGAAMIRLKALKAEAHADKRAALARREKAEELVETYAYFQVSACGRFRVHQQDLRRTARTWLSQVHNPSMSESRQDP